jgi:tRNA dimethylallyltransferase
MNRSKKGPAFLHKPEKVVVILGPTASGKSSAAIRLARKFDGEIISADSRQIFRGMDIGSGKITPEEQRIAPHHMLDIASPRTIFSAAKFKKQAEKHIQDILKRNRLPMICGGTGFWIQAIVDNAAYPEVKPDFGLRKRLDQKSTEELLAALEKLDPTRAKNIDIRNRVRLIRAIEICQTLGKVPPVQNLHRSSRYDFLQIGILRDKKILHERIRSNVRERLENGMIAEVEKLRSSGLSWKKIESFGLSYRLVPMFLRGEIDSEKELEEKIYQAEKDYAKRQMTWFAKDKRIIWLEKYADMEKAVSSFLEN